MSRILVVDADRQLCELLAALLTAEGYHVECIHCGEQALTHIQQHPIELVILDTILPNINGLQIARRICQRFATPIIMLSAAQDQESILKGYQAGADQYVTKPLNNRDLLTRIKVILRRVGLEKLRHSLVDSIANTDISDQLSRIQLTTTESELLEYLIKQQGVVVSKSQLQCKVLRKELCPFDRNLDMHISNIRRKMVQAGLSKQHIKTVRGQGYIYLKIVKAA
ncbi:MAG: response regulator transcription factor [Psychromonas sp.]